MTKDEAYKELEQTIGACFGWGDKAFENHGAGLVNAEEKKAFIEQHALEKGKVRTIIAKWLYDKEVAAGHLDAQLETAMAFFFPPEGQPETGV